MLDRTEIRTMWRARDSQPPVGSCEVPVRHPPIGVPGGAAAVPPTAAAPVSQVVHSVAPRSAQHPFLTSGPLGYEDASPDR